MTTEYKEFLRKLDIYRDKVVYARITALKLDETPIEFIEGKVTQGSINVDGTSAVRRSCSLSMVAEDVNINEYYWGLNTKFKLEIGLKNYVDDFYPDIIWFKQGIYVITNFSTVLATNNYTINIQGKDKMCLLDGSIGGSMNSSVDFGKFEEEDMYGNITITQYPIKDIIRDSVHQYGGEPFHNIVINDIDDMGLELMEYRYDAPLFLIRHAEDDASYDNCTFDGQKICWLTDGTQTTFSGTPADEEAGISEIKINYDLLIDPLISDYKPTQIYLEDPEEVEEQKAYCLAKIDYGETAGYRTTELTYPGDLIANIGESLTSILDKIKNMLGEFEYFYDLDGRFVFQKKKIFTNTPFTPEIKYENGISYIDESLALSSANTYTFTDGQLVTTFNNTPDLNNLKNDYSVWGVKKSITGKDLPVHMRYAIDEKPIYYKNFDGQVFIVDESQWDDIVEIKREEIIQQITHRINSFQLQHEIDPRLPAPVRQLDGSWSAGWWDIRDWYTFYMAITLEEPKYTMKWYSSNDMEGCVKTKTIPGYSNYPDSSYVWLVIRGKDGKYNIQHGSGDPTNGRQSLRIKQESYLDENGKLHTVVSQPEEKKYFIYPYAGCSDNHTYLEFLKGDIEKNGNDVYFYNPNFPGYDTFWEVVENQIEKELAILKENYHVVDWREILYQMSLDYRKHHRDDDFELALIENNGDYYPTGKTGYEQYYIDMEGFWRELYNPFLLEDIVEAEEKVQVFEITADYVKKELETLNPESNKYQEILREYEKVQESLQYQIKERDSLIASQEQYYNYTEEEEDSEKHYWNKIVYEAPETLNFWIDFLDFDGDIMKYSVQMVGHRPKAVNDTTVKAIYFRETPTIIFTSESKKEEQYKTGYRYFQIPIGAETMFSISAQGKSAKDAIDELLYNHSYCTENITISTIPIYYLEPNTRVHVFDKDTRIEGDYIINRLTIPLNYNGIMSITANKAPKNLL